MCLKGKESFEERKRLLIQHKEKILNDMKNLEKSLTTIQYKIDHYKELGIFHIDRE